MLIRERAPPSGPASVFRHPSLSFFLVITSSAFSMEPAVSTWGTCSFHMGHVTSDVEHPAKKTISFAQLIGLLVSTFFLTFNISGPLE